LLVADPAEYNLVDEESAKQIKRSSGNGWKWVATLFIVGIMMLIGGLYVRASSSSQTCNAVQDLRDDIIIVLVNTNADPDFLKTAKEIIGRPECS
jgi:hypothetical protein